MSCKRAVPLSSTGLQVIRHVTPSNSNPIGIMHGGYMLEWIVDTATLTAMRLARSYTLLACIEDTVFISPVRVGDIVILTSWVEYIGRSSIDVAVLVETENPRSGEKRLTTASSLTLVSVDDNLRPKPVGICLESTSSLEEEILEEAIRRRVGREERIKDRRTRVKDTSIPKPLISGYFISSMYIVNPEDSLGYNVLHGGRLLRKLDEITSIVASKYAQGVVVTGAVDVTDFYTPIKVGHIVEINATLSYVGFKSVEVKAKVNTINPLTWERLHASTSYFTFVHIGVDGASTPVRGFKPEYEWQEELIREAIARKERRESIIRMLKSKQTLEKLSLIKEKIIKL
ncbi:MAG: hotdog domain-containing protein [Acidilobaceae archaeon]